MTQSHFFIEFVLWAIIMLEDDILQVLFFRADSDSSILNRNPAPTKEKQLECTMLPPPYFSVGVHTYFLTHKAPGSFPQNILCHFVNFRETSCSW